MNVCRYCGGDNDEAVRFCSECGASEWKVLPTPKAPGSTLEVQTKQVGPQPVLTTSGAISSIQCRTPNEARLIAAELINADIIPVVANLHEVQVSTKVLEADAELSDAVSFRGETACAQQPLPLSLKLVAFCLPAMLPAAPMIFILGRSRFRNDGLTRKMREWRRWFVFGLIAWAAVVVILMEMAKG